MAGYDRFFGFDQAQRYTLEKLLDTAAAGVPATEDTPGTVLQAEAQADFAGADVTALKVELNAFLAKLEAAGIVAT